MPEFVKDELKKKDEQRLDEMQQEINEEQTAEEAPEVETAEEVAAADSEDSAAIIERLRAEVKEKEERALRLQADFENFRRRTAKEKEELAAVVTQSILTDMLPLVDNFERAMAAEAKDGEAFTKGVEMIFTQLGEVLKKNGLEHIETEGKAFDPNFHQAVMRVASPELEDDMIAAELQKGYMVKGRVIRPSMVQVVAN